MASKAASKALVVIFKKLFYVLPSLMSKRLGGQAKGDLKLSTSEADEDVVESEPVVNLWEVDSAKSKLSPETFLATFDYVMIFDSEGQKFT